MRTSGGAYSLTVVLVVLVVALVFSTAATAEKADERYLKMFPSQWCDTSRPFCNRCTICDRSSNPRCMCADLTISGCDVPCENCVQSPLAIYPPRFQCNDLKYYYCKNSCEQSGQ